MKVIRYLQPASVGPVGNSPFDTSTTYLAKALDWSIFAAEMKSGREWIRVAFCQTPVPKIETEEDVFFYQDGASPELLRHPLLWMGTDLIRRPNETDEELVYRVISQTVRQGLFFDGGWLDVLLYNDLDIDTPEGRLALAHWRAGIGGNLRQIVLPSVVADDIELPSLELLIARQAAVDTQHMWELFTVAQDASDVTRVLTLANLALPRTDANLAALERIKDLLDAGEHKGATDHLFTLLERNLVETDDLLGSLEPD